MGYLLEVKKICLGEEVNRNVQRLILWYND
jgi:hypothetical protein